MYTKSVINFYHGAFYKEHLNIDERNEIKDKSADHDS